MALPISRCQAEVMEHGGHIEKIGVEAKALALSCQCGPVVDAHGVLEQQVTFRIANDLGCIACQFAVGNGYPRYLIASALIRLSGLRRRRLALRVRYWNGPNDNQSENGESSGAERTDLHGLSPSFATERTL